MIVRNGLRVVLTGALLTSAASAAADTLVQYSFNSGSPTASTTGTMTGSDVSFGAFSSPGSTPSIDALGVLVRADDTNTSAATGSSLLSAAIATNDYITFTIASTSPTPFSISDISYNYTVANVTGVILSTHLLTSATGFTAGDSLQTTNITSNGTTSVAVDLSGNSALQNLTSPLEVRIYFSDSTFLSAPLHRVDEIVVQGVPEPGSLALLAMGGICLLYRRRIA